MAEKYWYGGVSGYIGNWDFDGIDPFTLDAGEVTESDSGNSVLPATGHPLDSGQEITISGTNFHDGTYTLTTETTDDTLVIPLSFVIESGTDGTLSGTQFTASEIDLVTNGVQAGMILRLSNSTAADGDYEIVSIDDSVTLSIAETLDSESSITFEIIRAETFDGTEIVTPNIDSNWRLVSDGSNTTKPADDDIIHFNDRAYYNSDNKRYQDCKINVDAIGTDTPNLAGIFVSSGFDGYIGSSTTPLEINCENGDIIVDGQATVYLKLSAGDEADAGCSRVVVNNEKAIVYVSSLLNNETYTGLYDLLVCLKGSLIVQDNCAVTEIVSANSNSEIEGGTGIETVKTETLCSISAVKGAIVWLSSIDQLKLYDAEFSWGQEDMEEVSGAFCNLLTIYSKSGEFIWQMADVTESVIKKFVLYAGNLTASSSINSAYPKKIGTETEISELWPDATADLNSSSNNVLIAEGSKLESHGGTLIASSGSLLGW